MADQQHALARRQAGERGAQGGGLPRRAAGMLEEGVKRRQIAHRPEAQQAGGLAAAAPLAGQDQVETHPGGAQGRPGRPRLGPAGGVQIALCRTIADLEMAGIAITRGQGVAHHADRARRRERRQSRTIGTRARRAAAGRGRHEND